MEWMDKYTKLFTSLAATLREFADELANSEADQIAIPAAAETEHPARPADEHTLGPRQLQIVELPGLAAEDGMKTAAVAAAIDYDVPNTYSALQVLARSQVVEQVAGKDPQHWRLARRYRAGSRTFERVADLVGRGEWTTAADISIAVRGDIQATDSLLRAGLSHRVLADALADDEHRRALEAEGVTFLADGYADPRQRVGWDELSRRAAVSRRRKNMTTQGTLNYIEIPAVDLDESATFYEEVFGWSVTRSPNVAPGLEQTSYPTFADATGRVGGGFVLGRPASKEAGILPCILVEDIDETLQAVVDNGGDVARSRTPIVEGTDWEATFRDPAGNVMGLFESVEHQSTA
jgi:predicted enzyme related to lactoylglutathione lyase